MNDKKTMIYEATFDLLLSGLNINELTIQAIATRANIGKGTVYEYFKSKEEILIDTIIYVIDIELDKVNKIIDNNTNFKDTIREICLNVIKAHQKLSSFQLAFRNDEVFTKERLCQSGINDRILKTVAKLIDKGKDEGIIAKEHSFDYCSYVILGASNSFSFYASRYKNDINKYADYAYQMIEKSLS